MVAQYTRWGAVVVTVAMTATLAWHYWNSGTPDLPAHSKANAEAILVFGPLYALCFAAMGAVIGHVLGRIAQAIIARRHRLAKRAEQHRQE